jgi:hypothetical protein
MRIYTYYEDINFKFQNQLIELWQRSWHKQGFTPIILHREDAKKSPLYQEYYDFVQSVHESSVGQTLTEKEYCLAAQLEIVAFHTIKTPAYISDYDMINNGFEIGEQLESMVHWRNDACSCFASGDTLGWYKYIKFLMQNKRCIVDWCKKTHQNSSRIYFHDQDFLVAIRQKGMDENIYKMYRDLNVSGAGYDPYGKNICKVIHISHNNIYEIKQKYVEYKNENNEYLRALFAQQIIKNL